MSETADPAGYVFGPYRLIPGRRQLLDERGAAVALRGKSFDLLCYLVRHSGRLVEKQELLDAVWPGAVVEENNLNQAMTALRHALADDAHSPRYIATIKGRGFQFIGNVDETPDSARDDGSARRPRTRAATVTLLVAMLGVALYFARFQTNHDDASSIVVLFDDANLRLVTDEPGSQSEPALSPDGTMIAYVSDAGGSSQIWVRNLQRGGPIRITDGPYPAMSPTWSATSEQILFTRVEPDGPSVFSVGTLGSPDPRRVVAGGADPKYAMDADAFAYTVGSEIWLAGRDGTSHERIEGVPVSQGFAPRMPALSPDGKWVAFVHADEGPFGNIWVIPASGGNARQLTDPDSVGGFAANPDWSNDGRYLVFDVAGGTSGSHLWRVDIESGDSTSLTTGSGGAVQPTVSADGRRLAYTDTRPVWRLTRLDPETGRRSSIYESRNPVLLPVASPDGQDIVFFSAVASGAHLFVINADGKGFRQLTFDERGENTLPTWTSDNESVVYYKDRSLHVLDLADGTDSELYADFHWSSRNWLSVHGDRFTYHEIDRPARQHRTVVRKFAESDITELRVPIEAAQWSSDGSSLLGFHRRTRNIMVCDPGGSSCQAIEPDGQPVRGMRPKWSRDERRVYFLRPDDSGECCALWRMDRDGANVAPIGVLEGFQLANSYFGIDAEGKVFYNHMDDSTDEIWLAIIDE